ncbi:MAG TPA: hypothetical protein VMY41_11595, partial [Thermohalobaculum sp.]|nr:hypothetical protein [Thermohalobaculum sp.]
MSGVPEFWLDGDEWDIGYQNLRDGENGPCLAIRECIDHLWESFYPFADKDFVSEFARQPDARFWEMYLTTSLLANGKNVRPRAERPKAGPDILVEESGTRVWIEAVTFGPGIDVNPDRVLPLKFDGNA